MCASSSTCITSNFKFKKLKACGEQPQAAASMGIKVERTQMMAVIFSSTISGVAGAFFAQGNSGYFRGSTQGIGFLAVAIVIFGQWRPLYIIAGAVLFGALYAVVDQSVLIPGLNKFEHKEILQIFPYLISLIVLVFTQKKSKAPKALGVPYDQAKR